MLLSRSRREQGADVILGSARRVLFNRGVEQVAAKNVFSVSGLSKQDIASVVELVYTSDLKSDGLTAMRVQVPPLAPLKFSIIGLILKRLKQCSQDALAEYKNLL